MKHKVVLLLLMLAAQSCARATGREIVVHGDSTAIAGRIALSEKLWNVFPSLDGHRWWTILGASYTPHRRVRNDGVGGQSIARLRDKMVADQAEAAETTIIYDRVNAEEDPATYMRTLEAAIRTLRTTRFLIMPQVPNSGPARDLHAEQAMPAINAALLARWPRNTFDVAERSRFLKELDSPDTRVDSLHRNAKGQAIEARYIKAWLDARGW